MLAEALRWAAVAALTAAVIRCPEAGRVPVDRGPLVMARAMLKTGSIFDPSLTAKTAC